MDENITYDATKRFISHPFKEIKHDANDIANPYCLLFT